MMLLGYSFSTVDVTETHSSLLAAALCDLAAYFGDADLYCDIVNDIKASHIYPEYWQPQDSVGVCGIESADVVQIPHVEFNDAFTDFARYQHGPHLIQELDRFEVADVFGATSLVALMLLLRDRYFPKMWPQFI